MKSFVGLLLLSQSCEKILFDFIYLAIVFLKNPIVFIELSKQSRFPETSWEFPKRNLNKELSLLRVGIYVVANVKSGLE